jgi:predicted nucleotidyltransferase
LRLETENGTSITGKTSQGSCCKTYKKPCSIQSFPSYLAEKSGIKIPEKILVKLREFMEFHLEARYPDANKSFYKKCTKVYSAKKVERNERGIHMGKGQAVRVIKKFVNALKREGITIDRVILYGSYVKGNVRPDSDIDVAVISKDFGKDRVEEGMTLLRIAGRIDPRLEPVTFPTKMYEEDTWVPLIYEIRKRGEELKIS